MKIANKKSIPSDTLALRMSQNLPVRRGSKKIGITSLPRTVLYLEASESVVGHFSFLLVPTALLILPTFVSQEQKCGIFNEVDPLIP